MQTATSPPPQPARRLPLSGTMLAVADASKTLTGRRTLPLLVTALAALWLGGCYLLLTQHLWTPGAQAHRDALYVLGGAGLAGAAAFGRRSRAWLPLAALSFGALALYVPVVYWPNWPALLITLAFAGVFCSLALGFYDGREHYSFFRGLGSTAFALLLGVCTFGIAPVVLAVNVARRKPPEEVVIPPVVEIPAEPVQPLEDILAELDEIVGQDEVKREVRGLVSFIEIERERGRRGYSDEPITLHLAFTGPPGTGKTSVARVIAKLYHALGLLPTSRVTVVQAGTLPAGFVRQTSQRANEIIDGALGGVLVLDEIGALIPKGENDFAREANKVLLDRTENDRDQLVVIVTGYPDEVTDWLASDDGLDSRVPHSIHFVNSTTPELVEIYKRKSARGHYLLSPEGREALSAEFERRGPDSGNGRLARNLFEASRRAQSERLDPATAKDLSDEEICALTAADIALAATRVRDDPRARHRS